MKATEIVNARLFSELRSSRNKRKTKSKAAHGKYFGSDDQIGNHGFFDDAPAILKGIAIEKYIACDNATLSSDEKIPTEFDPGPLSGEVRSS